MLALRAVGWAQPPVLQDVPEPRPGEGEVLLEVLAAGVCQSDLHVLDAPEGVLPYVLPCTLGHEVAGRVVALGPGVAGPDLGAEVLVHGPVGCGGCPACAVGEDNHCRRRAELRSAGIGLGRDGGMAELVVVPARALVGLRGLDPVAAVGLTDAGLTSYAALEATLPELREGTTAVVVGVGGLGHLAVQVLRALTDAQVIAVDSRVAGRELATASGAHAALEPDGWAEQVQERMAGAGAELVLDVVGSQSTLDSALRVVATGGQLTVVGSGDGALALTKGQQLVQGLRVALPFWGSRRQLERVVELAVAGVLHVDHEFHPLSDGPAVLERLRRGEVSGRAVLVPDREAPAC
ncbi:MAG: alcohol dehydrogenase GroES-like protein [Frankiales bacterium]|nr:alcohol dehydrogenase GroES-like protein [Frankiales bacterium]